MSARQWRTTGIGAHDDIDHVARRVHVGIVRCREGRHRRGHDEPRGGDKAHDHWLNLSVILTTPAVPASPALLPFDATLRAPWPPMYVSESSSGACAPLLLPSAKLSL